MDPVASCSGVQQTLAIFFETKMLIVDLPGYTIYDPFLAQQQTYKFGVPKLYTYLEMLVSK